MIYHFHLLFYNGNSLGKVVVFPDFPGQLVKACIGYGLGLTVCDKNTREGHKPTDKRHDDFRYHNNTPINRSQDRMCDGNYQR